MLTGLLSMTCSICFFKWPGNHLPRAGTNHSGLGSPINQENTPQMHPLANLMEAPKYMVISSQVTLVGVKLTKIYPVQAHVRRF